MITLSQLLQRGLGDLGRTDTFTASAGAQNSATRTDFELLPTPPKDNYAVNFALFVAKTTDGLAPQGEFGWVVSYASGQYTLASNLTATIGVGDEIVITDSLFPLQEMIQRANRAMEKLGEIWAIDNSITTDSNKREYTLPAKIVRRPELIEIETNTADADDPDYIKIDDWDVIPGAPGSTGLLVFDHQPTAARKLKIHYGGLHPDLTTYSSQISETVHPNVAVAYFVEAALEWFVGKVAGSKANSFWVARWNEAQRNAAVQLALFPVPKPELQDKFFTLPGNEYDPDEGYYAV